MHLCGASGGCQYLDTAPAVVPDGWCAYKQTDACADIECYTGECAAATCTNGTCGVAVALADGSPCNEVGNGLCAGGVCVAGAAPAAGTSAAWQQCLAGPSGARYDAGGGDGGSSAGGGSGGDGVCVHEELGECHRDLGLPLWQDVCIALGAGGGMLGVALLSNLIVRRVRTRARTRGERGVEPLRKPRAKGSTEGVTMGSLGVSGGGGVSVASGGGAGVGGAGAGPVRGGAIPLPRGWEEVTTDGGDTYYWNRETNDTCWEAPIAHKSGQLMSQSV